MARLHQRTQFLFVVFVLLVSAFGLQPQAAWAEADAPEATLVVTTLQDKIDPNDGFCSLREAMARAFDNSNNNTIPNDCPQSTGNTTIKFGVAGTIKISNGVDGGQLPNIINIVTLVGPITIDAGQADQILFDVESSGKLNFVNVNIKNAKWTAVDSRGELKIAGGTFENNSAGGAGGGAIRNDGLAMIAGVKFINNKAVKKDAAEGSKDGGAIRSTWVLTVAGSTFNGNISDNEGGAIKIMAGRMTIMDSTFTGNVTEGSLCPSCLGAGGGAIATAANGNVYPFTIKRTAFQGNIALKGVGGAIFHNADTLMTITDSSFQANHAGSPGNEGAGGAIRTIYDMAISRSTFTANSVQGDGGALSVEASGIDREVNLRMVGFAANNASGRGGAISSTNLSSSAAKINGIGVQVTGNIASSLGGGIYNHESQYDTAEFRMSVWAGNLPQNCRDKQTSDENTPDPTDTEAWPIDSKGQNYFSDNTCESDDENDDTNPGDPGFSPDPMLAAPAANGGMPGMLTQKPLIGSPLIDKVDPANNPNDPETQTDVRGKARPMNGDGIGAALFDIGPFEADDATPKFSSLPVAPGPLAIGTAPTGQPLTKNGALKIYNGGDIPLTLSGLTIGGANAGDFALTLPASVSANGQASVNVTCTPSAAGARVATISFNTNDPAHPAVSFDASCTGQPGAVPGFGPNVEPPGPLTEITTLGTPDPFVLGVSETGNATLVLSNPALVSDPPGAITLNTAFPLNIADGGGAALISFTCAASSIGLHSAVFTFNTNDPDRPNVSYNLTCTVNKPKDPFFGPTFSTGAGLSGVSGPYGLAISPDGKHVYVADEGDSRVAAYAVGNNNILAHIASYDSASLAATNAFTAPYQVAVSADGKNVYATGLTADSIATFSRDSDTGALTWIDTVRNGAGYGCIPLPCDGTVAGLDGAYGIALSPDGKFIYVSSITEDSVVVFQRSTTTGAPSSNTFLGGAYFVQRFTHPNLNSAYGLVMSPDGANVYVAGYTSDTLLTLKRDPTTGELTFVQSLGVGDAAGLDGVFRATMSDDGNFVYTASFDSNSVCAFRRNTLNGQLTWTGCYTNANLTNASDVAITPDGKHLLATGYGSDSVLVYNRNLTTGILTFNEVITKNGSFPAINGARGVIVHPNNKAAYVTGNLDDQIVSFVFAQPLPVLNAVLPASKPAGTGDVALTVTGIDFQPQSTVQVNGAALPTTYLNETKLQANLPAAYLAGVADLAVTVNTPAPGGGTSNARTFSVLASGAPAVPAIESINLLGVLAGSAGATIEVKGADFEPAAVVLFNGSARPTTRVSAALIQATLSASDLAFIGPVVITVSNVPVVEAISILGGESVDAPNATSKSNTVAIHVVAPNANAQPGITNITPASSNSLIIEPQIEVTINGNGFTPESQAMWNGEARPTTYVNANQIKMILSAGDLAEAGTASIKVANPAPGGGESNVETFSILGPPPQIVQYWRYMPLIVR
jgi:CSLREA domain-containing protein